MLNAGHVINNRYEIIKMVGKGGMSTVYQARDRVTGKLLAVKDVARTPGEDTSLVERSLISEGNMLKQLSNPHLPKIYDLIINPENYFLVMDFVHGESLDKRITRDGAQPVLWVLDWGMQICEVFEYLHNQPVPIIYRDMKPANLILQPNGHLMMIDFGTARTQKTNLAMAADTICFGTAGFAAPEQFGGIGQSTPRTDIFCLGGTLYNLVTGHSPCDRPQGILPLENWNPALKDSPLSYIITKCTRNDPNERYQTARELYEDLNRARMGTFVPPDASGRASKKNDAWQKQNVKGAGFTSGLSGLLKRNKAPQQAPPQPPVQSQGWQQSPQTSGQPRPMQPPVIQQPPAPAPVRPAAPPGAPTPQPPAQRYPSPGGPPNVGNSPGFAVQSPPAMEPLQTRQDMSRHQSVATQPPPPVMEGEASATSQMWKKLAILGAVVAILMMLVGIGCMFLSTVGGLVFMVIALLGVTLALVGAIKSKKAEA